MQQKKIKKESNQMNRKGISIMKRKNIKITHQISPIRSSSGNAKCLTHLYFMK